MRDPRRYKQRVDAAMGSRRRGQETVKRRKEEKHKKKDIGDERGEEERSKSKGKLGTERGADKSVLRKY